MNVKIIHSKSYITYMYMLISTRIYISKICNKKVLKCIKRIAHTHRINVSLTDKTINPYEAIHSRIESIHANTDTTNIQICICKDIKWKNMTTNKPIDSPHRDDTCQSPPRSPVVPIHSSSYAHPPSQTQSTPTQR